MAGGKVVFNKGHVKREVRAAAEEAAAALAFWIEGQTKQNITANGQIDTGFMRASTFSVTKSKGSSQGQASTEANGRNPDARMGSKPSLGNADAAVAVGADYAIYQEVKQSFLYKAGEQAVSVVKSVAEPAFRKKLG